MTSLIGSRSSLFLSIMMIREIWIVPQATHKTDLKTPGNESSSETSEENLIIARELEYSERIR